MGVSLGPTSGVSTMSGSGAATTPLPPETAAPRPVEAPVDDWKERAACRDRDPDIFFGRPDKYGVDRHDPNDLLTALGCCAGCDVREECLDAALDGGPDVYGVWGGTTKEDRERLRRGIPRVKCPVCVGKTLHTIDGVQTCGGCGHSWRTARSTVQDRASAPAAAA